MVGPVLVFGLALFGAYEFLKPKPAPLPQATTASGVSGTVYGVALVSAHGTTTTFDVYLLSTGVRVLRYSRTGTAPGILVESPLPAADPVLRTAITDFGLVDVRGTNF